MDIAWFWNGWDPIIRGAIMAVTGYLTLVILLRGAGPRTLSSMTPLDLIAAVTIGSAFGRVLTAKDVAATQVVAVLFFLIVIKWLLAQARARWTWARKLVDYPPVLLYHDGRMMPKALKRHRLLEDDVFEVVRTNGHGSMRDVHSVVLLMDGAFAVITHDNMGDGSTIYPYTQPLGDPAPSTPRD